jgi:hypothetical protein
LNNNPFLGKWSYRSFFNDPNEFLDDIGNALSNPDALLQNPHECLALLQKMYGLVFGNGTLEITESHPNILVGTIGGPGWQLELFGSRSYGNPMEVRFQGKGVVSGSGWLYAYVGYLVPQWPNGIQQRAAMVGSIVRVISHPSSDGGISPAGVVASWYAVKQDNS